jgi:hypothetical protein
MLFVPRQVRLASLPAAPAAAAMAKEEAKKEKKSKSKTAATSKTSPAPDARVLAAVAAFLESSGLPRTLAALQSEANLEVYHPTLTLSHSRTRVHLRAVLPFRCKIIKPTLLFPGRLLEVVAGEPGRSDFQVAGLKVPKSVRVTLQYC